MPFRYEVDTEALRPAQHARLRRLGSEHDGGYVVPLEALERAELLLSFGIARDWAFERDVRRLNAAIRVDAYDHTVGSRELRALAWRSTLSVPLRLVGLSGRTLRESLANIRAAIDYREFFRGDVRHFRQRVWYNSERNSAAIERILESAGSTKPCSIFAKIDIEGTEYRILPAMLEQADRFSGLAIEFHDTDRCAELFNRLVRELKASFHLVHVHGNNYGDVSSERAFPIVLELSFVNKALVASAPLPYEGPLPRADVDRPNDPDRPDYELRFGSATSRVEC